MKNSSLAVLASPAFKAKQVNPYTSSLYEQLSTLGVNVQEFSVARLYKRPAPDIWHIHFPQSQLRFRNPIKLISRLLRLLIRLRRARSRGTKVVWTVHNLHPHENPHPWLEKIFWRLFLANVDGCIHLSESGRMQAVQRFPGIARIPNAVVPHPHYRGLYPDSSDRQQARQILGLESDAKIALFLGQIRPYKNVPELIQTFRAIDDPDMRLVIAGWPREKQLRRHIQGAADGDARVHLHPEFVPNDRIQYYLRAADIMVAPYRDILNSGTALLALSFDRPILAPSKGSLTELQTIVGKNWIKLYSGDMQPDILGSTLEEAHHQKLGQPCLDSYDRTAIAQATLDAYHHFLRPNG